MSIKRLQLFLLLITGLTWVAMPALSAAAQAAPTPQDIIQAVNTLRTANGLAPYTIDASLMAYAQEHANYQASIKQSTHYHSDGSTPWMQGIEENVAFGTGLLTADYTVNTIWRDEVHWKVMMSYSGGSAGAGVATDGGNVYISFDVRPVGAAAPAQPAAASPAAGSNLAANLTPTVEQVIGAIVIATPGPDGAIVHVVENGQALVSIALAYGVKIADIRALNNIPEDSTNIMIGQKLIIRRASATLAVPAEPVQAPTGAQPAGENPALTPTAAATAAALATATQPPLLPTPEKTIPPTSKPRSTRAHTSTPQPRPPEPADPRSGFIALIIACGIGLLVVIYTGFIRKS